MITFNGKTQTQKAWAAEIGIAESGISRRISQGWSLEKVLTTPARNSTAATNEVLIAELKASAAWQDDP